ncbi:hypothetical protein [Methylobacterium sp. WSM2598]|uniref:hypothetical protein n=1 Tax=Methylobacterium sp. WSM2598 TaxID=398261 RepID=UPI000374328E|nr:hypothetical protein [Methylobacterium sp. WSM2598]
MAAKLYAVDVIAKLLDLSPRRIQQLSADGIIPKPTHGQYDLVGAVKGYVRFLAARASPEDPSTDDYIAQRARLTKARADLAGLELAQLRGELVPADDIEAAWGAAVGAMRSRLLGLPAKTAPRAITLRSAAEVTALIRREMIDILAELDGVEVTVTSPIRPTAPEGDGAPGDE